MPLMLVIAEAQWMRTGRPHYKELAHQWAKATALTFAVGCSVGHGTRLRAGPALATLHGGVGRHDRFCIAFPSIYATLSVALFAPLHLVLFGIVLRGAAFVFRAYGRRAGAAISATERGWGVVFGAASTVTPLLLGMSLGAVSTGRIRMQDGVIEAAGAWTAPVSVVTGFLALYFAPTWPPFI